MKTANYNIRLDPSVKTKAEETFAAFGLNLSEAINVFLHMSIKWHGFPFEIRDPVLSAETLQAIDEAEQLAAAFADGTRKPKRFTNAAELMAAMDAEDAAEGENG